MLYFNLLIVNLCLKVFIFAGHKNVQFLKYDRIHISLELNSLYNALLWCAILQNKMK